MNFNLSSEFLFKYSQWKEYIKILNSAQVSIELNQN